MRLRIVRPSKNSYAFFKPYGVECKFTKEPGKTTLGNCLKLPPRVYPIGRLDADSEGLLILSDDRRFNQALLNPRAALPKTYLALVEGQPSEEKLEALRRGVRIKIKGKGYYTTLPCRAELTTAPDWLPPRCPPPAMRPGKTYSWLQIVVREGKNRQVRRMTAAIGHPTLRLIRVGVGRLSLEGMKPGELRPLSAREIQQLLFSFADP